MSDRRWRFVLVGFLALEMALSAPAALAGGFGHHGPLARQGARVSGAQLLRTGQMARIRASGHLAGDRIARAGVAGLRAAGAPETGPVIDVSTCPDQNAEVESAADPARGFVYQEWMGCRGIGFARSTDGGRTYGPAITLPGSVVPGGSWDPALAVAPNGTVYAAFMVYKDGRTFPVVDASFDGGATFPQVTELGSPEDNNWGDRDFIAVGPDGTVYVTWDYGPSAAEVTFICSPVGSCSFATGDLNAVIQSSRDGGRTFGPMSHVSPGFPASGADSAPLLVEPGGRIDALYQGYDYTDPSTLTLGTALEYFTSSADGGHTWSPPVAVGPQVGSENTSEWWIDGDLARDAGGTLYATWDTQSADADVGWLSYSTDGGGHWSAPAQVTPDRLFVPHIVQVVAGAPGRAYVAWLSGANPLGYALDRRTFTVAGGWVTPPLQVSPQYGDPTIWPGDTIGISLLGPGRLVLSWGSATPATVPHDEIWATTVAVSH